MIGYMLECYMPVYVGLCMCVVACHVTGEFGIAFLLHANSSTLDEEHKGRP